MDFAFTDEQDALREGVRTVFDTECTVGALRAFELARRGRSGGAGP